MLLIVSFVIAALAVIFAIQNGTPATIHFFAWQFVQSQGVVLLVGFVAGFLSALLIYMPSHLGRKWQLRRRERQLAELESQLAEEKTKRDFIEREHAAALRIKKSNQNGGGDSEP